ncbi:MAG: hypothetical protein ACPHEP_04460 [Acidimicrobiales bacterium]
MSFIEQRIESTIRDQLDTDFAAAGITCDVRTLFAEPAYDDNDELLSMPNMWVMASPCTRPIGSEPFREVMLSIDGRTHYNDDYDRSVFSEMYRVSRKTIETTDWDFGSGITVHEYEMPNQGAADIDENQQSFSFGVTFKICATNFDL